VSRLLVADVGNTTARVGVWNGTQVVQVSVHPTAQPHEGLAALERLAGESQGPCAVALCSVVPPLESRWTDRVAQRGWSCFVVCGDTPAPLVNRYREPKRLGGDRLAAAVAAVRQVGAPAVVVSLGTATVVDAVSAESEFLGGAIAAGVDTGLRALAEMTAALPRVPLGDAAGPVGSETGECLRAGAVIGTAALVEGLVSRMREQIGAAARVAITGGHAELVSRHLRVDHGVFPHLVLEGIALLWEHNRGGRGC
jgi:type III pantothenate kinase